MKHRHKWELIWTYMFDKGGLLWICDCGSCLEFRKKLDYKKATEVLLKIAENL